MAYQALYRTYRPSSFEEMAGQKHILRTLHNAVKQNKIAHAYLFTGPRGTGKTSVARILAKAVNCLNQDSEQLPCNHCASCLSIQAGTHPDIIEIDAASNNGVDEVRDLIEKVKYAPIEGRYKVYIIDEVHMMSTGAFNALLKTLEEPPQHVLFILATTEPHKVLPTIISRCQRFDFTKISDAEIQNAVKEVIRREQIECDEDTVRLISTLAEGGMRDALSILDQCIAYAGNKIDIQTINEIYGITTVAEKLKLLQYVQEKDVSSLLAQIHSFLDRGIDVKRLCINLMEILKESIIYQLTCSADLLSVLREEEAKRMNEMFSANQKFTMVEILMDCQEKFRYASNLASYFELALLKMASLDENYQSSAPISEAKTTSSEQKPQMQPKSVKKPMTINGNTAPTANVKAPARKVYDYTVSEIINLLVQASKDDRREAEGKWSCLDQYFLDERHRKAAKWLSEGQIVASSQDFMLLAFKHQMMADIINDETNQKSITDLMMEIFGKPRLIVAISEEKRELAINEFLRLSKRKELPKPIPVKVPEAAVTQSQPVKNEVEEKLKSICGDILEILED